MASIITKFAHLQIPLEDVVKATNNFHHDNIIGQGGFGIAYKGRLSLSGNMMKIAARRLDRKLGEGDVEFWTEISMLSDLKHPNLVSIIGFCDEGDEKVIITTYAANGSLEKHLNRPNLTWMQRLRICVGVARALRYLHYGEGRGYAIIHRNINSDTILLDENWEAKLSGFEISIKQSVNRMDKVILSEPIGTIGHLDPATKKTRRVTHKSDIYAFGVILFEILCGRKAFIPKVANRLLAPLAKLHYENKTLQKIIYRNLWNQMSRKSLLVYSKAAYSCLKEEQTHRPDMGYIVVELDKALDLQLRRENLENNLKHLNIRLDDIKIGTHNFSSKYRYEFTENGYYTWYIGNVDHFDKETPSSIQEKIKSDLPKRHSTVIIKHFIPRDDEEGEELGFTEIEMLTSIKHRNIVTLLGFCVEDSEMILVFEYVSIGYLGNYLRKLNYMPVFENLH